MTTTSTKSRTGKRSYGYIVVDYDASPQTATLHGVNLIFWFPVRTPHKLRRRIRNAPEYELQQQLDDLGLPYPDDTYVRNNYLISTNYDIYFRPIEQLRYIPSNTITLTEGFGGKWAISDAVQADIRKRTSIPNTNRFRNLAARLVANHEIMEEIWSYPTADAFNRDQVMGVNPMMLMLLQFSFTLEPYTTTRGK